MAQRKWIVVTILAAVAALFYFARATNLDVSAGTVTLPVDSSSVIVVITLIAVSTFVSEDLTCIGAGVMVAQGRISFAVGAFACFLGIFVGDVLLFFAGRYLGRPAMQHAPLKWFIRAEDVEKSSMWFTRRGVPVILASRFVPGSRLPTYFAAGLLNTNFWWFSLYFLLAGAIWSPLLVGLSKVLGAQVIQSALLSGQSLVIKIVAAATVVFTLAKLATAMSSYRGRRMLLSRWRRWTRWEFWPAWFFYPPVICYILVLALKHRSATLFTAANPAIPSGGFIGESKIEILKGLSGDARIARASLIEDVLDLDERVARAKRFIEENELGFPVVLKPDEGQRGSGVAVVRSDEELKDYLNASAADTIIQEYVPGSEFGVFYYRRPDEERGRIFSITEKRFPVVTGNGASTLERLILEDERAVCMARFYFKKQSKHLFDVPASGERVQLVELGTHSMGAIFLDGGWARTRELEDAIDEISRRFHGFYFGRFDIRTPCVADLKAGKNFKVIELNGVTSEATHIYDPRNSLFAAYKILFEQWRIAFEIGAQNHRRGVTPTPIRALAKLLLDYKQRAEYHLAFDHVKISKRT
jgi:membrane protein DedA with SNARE-associated domain